ncbi:unnamed protein product [Sphagnum jensenii]|uniref:Uncharacterized protein n=1 Tax=Sphagnum jensenii TaxID=128206 RepID=A0ABP1BPN0_9BRYO
MFIITELGNIRAEHDENNEPLEQDAPSVMPNQIIKLRHDDSKCSTRTATIFPSSGPRSPSTKSRRVTATCSRCTTKTRCYMPPWTSTTCRRLSTTPGTRCHSKCGSSAYALSSVDWPPPSPTRLLLNLTSPFSSGRWMSSAPA